MRKLKLYQAIAQTLGALHRCEGHANEEWTARHRATLDDIVGEFMPHGSGFDSDVVMDDESTAERLIFHVDYHHMTGDGCYDGWTNHVVTVRPSLEFGFDLRVSGRDRNDIKNYIGEVFHEVLSRDVVQRDDGFWREVQS